jgi:hypothetical protein
MGYLLNILINLLAYAMETTTFRLNLARTYINAMEMLVEEEVDRRISKLSQGHQAYLNRMEIIAYALNKLPPLYATGEKGLEHQMQIGRTQHGARIQQAVQLSLAAVLRDPILNYTPLKLQAPAGMREILKRIQILLHNEQIDWETLPDILENLMKQTSRGNQIAAVNSVTNSRSIQPPMSAHQAMFAHYDNFDEDVTVGIPTSLAPRGQRMSSAEDKPWKRVRAAVANSRVVGGASSAWDDAGCR